MVNHLRNNILVAVVACLLSWAPFAGFGQIVLKEEAREAKLSIDLMKFQLKDADQRNNNLKNKNLRQAASSDDGLGGLSIVDQTQIRDGLIAIDATANEVDGQVLLNDLQSLGLEDGQYYQRIVSGYFPISKLSLLRNVATLRFARPSYKPLFTAGKVTSQGDKAMRADVARQTYNVTGAGSKVGVLSDSYNALKGAADGVASNDLPPNVQVLSDVAAGTDEGRAMAEIVHDVAPGANIAFHTANGGQVNFALGILRLAQAGCNVIVDDVFYYAEPFFQDGIIAQIVDRVTKEFNVSYFSSAGNHGRDSYTSSFRNSGKLPPGLPDFPLKGSAHDFGNGKITQRIIIAPGSTFRCIFQWSDPYYSQSILSGGVSGAKTDMDLLVYIGGVLIPQASSYGNNIGNDPFEGQFITNTGTTPLVLEIALVKVEGPDPAVIKWINFNNGDTGVQAEFATNSSTTAGHANAEKAIAVGASRYDATPVFNPALQTPTIRSFSSAGGTPILFTEYGQPFPIRVRLKPEIVAPDGGNNTFFPSTRNDFENDGFPNFSGTSASAPHAAAVAALLQEKARFNMSPDDIKKRLEVTAIDMDDPLTPGFDVGFDFRTGYGFIQADKALMFGEPLAIIEPIFDCQTKRITLQTTGGDGTPITFILPGVTRTSPTSTTGIVEAGVIADAKPIVITAIQSGVTKTYTFDFVEYCSRPRAFTLVAPLYNCSTGAITFQTAGGDGTTVIYTAPGIKRSSPTDPNGTIEAGLLYDPKPITITATQSGVTATYVFNFVAFCNNRARVASNEPGNGLQVSVLGNPIVSDWVSIEVRGAQGQPLKLQVNNTVGGLTSEQSVNMAADVEQHRVRLGQTPGLYLLQVSTPSQTKTVKIVRQ